MKPVSLASCRKALERKYTLPLLALLSILFTSPLIERFPALYPLPVFLIMTVVLTLLRVLRIDGRIMALAAACALLSFGLEVLWRYTHNLSLRDMPAGFAVVIFFPAITFYLIAILAMVRRVFTEKRVTGDTIWGGIMIYFLIGILWSRFYHLAAILDSGAFKPPLMVGDIFQVFYFSMSTLTTLGYGDFTPGNHATMVLSTLEAAAGQIYLAVFVARLIGLEIVHKSSANNALK